MARDWNALEEVASEVSTHSVEVEVLALDLANVAELTRLPERVRATRGCLDALLHAAGLYGSGPVSTPMGSAC